ncbi:MAG: NAD-dependent epimerase/dehydratase family protein [Planctomycetota bacterium]
MGDALVGSTGLVGGTLLRQRRFADCYRSTDIERIAGRRYDTIWCAGAPAEKWKANHDPAADRANLARLVAALVAAEARRVVVISTVDVFGDPSGVTEADEPSQATAYGRHRLELERALAARFPALVVRLPALYGRGMKKNAVYDLLHGNQPEKIDCRARYQFYDLERLAADVDRARLAGLSLVHLATEPVSMAAVARHAFGIEFANCLPGKAPAYDFRTRHGEVFGRSGPYVAGAAEVLDGIRAFVAVERSLRRCA